MVVTPSVIALVFTTIYAPDYGLLYGVFQRLGLAARFPRMLGDPALATYGIIAVNVWQWCGFFVLMYCVGIAAARPRTPGRGGDRRRGRLRPRALRHLADAARAPMSR